MRTCVTLSALVVSLVRFSGALALELLRLQFILLVLADEAAKSLAGVCDDDVPP
jgi:hypothetical protein